MHWLDSECPSRPSGRLGQHPERPPRVLGGGGPTAPPRTQRRGPTPREAGPGVRGPSGSRPAPAQRLQDASRPPPRGRVGVARRGLRVELSIRCLKFTPSEPECADGMRATSPAALLPAMGEKERERELRAGAPAEVGPTGTRAREQPPPGGRRWGPAGGPWLGGEPEPCLSHRPSRWTHFEQNTPPPRARQCPFPHSQGRPEEPRRRSPPAEGDLASRCMRARACV